MSKIKSCNYLFCISHWLLCQGHKAKYIFVILYTQSPSKELVLQGQFFGFKIKRWFWDNRWADRMLMTLTSWGKVGVETNGSGHYPPPFITGH